MICKSSFITRNGKFSQAAKREEIYTVLLTTARLAEVQSHQLHHVRFQQVHVPPWSAFRLRQGAGLRRVSLTAASVNRALWKSALHGAGLHRRFAACHVQNCKRELIQLSCSIIDAKWTISSGVEK